MFRKVLEAGMRQMTDTSGNRAMLGARLGMVLGAIALGACSSSVSRVPIEPSPVAKGQAPEASLASAATVSGAAALESTTAEISADDRATIRQLGVPLVVPTVLPPETYLSDVVVTSDPDWGKEYTLYYRSFSADSAIATCFQIEYSDGGFGGPVPPNSRPIETPAIARSNDPYFIYWADNEASSDDSPFPANAVFSDWIEVPGVPGGYRLSSGLIDSELVRACNFLDPDSAVAIASSLDRLEP
ncbi:hypothetical protein [Thermoleptolyngbya sp. C42_A2020_037]|uniref:hypothetical protein n=1 Tax=Thermoleptolyngbya sp. C42_A2020_037 TaxID=2747799 RepID=UPI0019E6D5C7|nr:hypothetical protein [Thermoleptolyngbya sp. C42_A2020_037]MBF2085955.1 hypothetical protein [Thermoleptolyngbya sp. C42_A2020_037]